MLNLISEKGNFFITPNHWAEVRNLHFSSDNEQVLSLNFDFSSETTLLYLSNLKLINYDCLRNKTLITPSLLHESFLHEAAFSPLRNELEENFISGLSNVEITMLTYFYLNPLPFSISMIARWFTDSYIRPHIASKLASAAFIARTNRNDSEPKFLQEVKLGSVKTGKQIKDVQKNNHPATLAEAFEFLKKVETAYSYDCLEVHKHTGYNEKRRINLSGIIESGYLIEDHAFIIAGLSVSITEIVKLTELKWPVFTESVLNEIPVYIRDFYSIGRLIAEKPAIMLSLNNEGITRMDIIVIQKNGLQLTQKLQVPTDCLICLSLSTAIPLFFRITK